MTIKHRRRLFLIVFLVAGLSLTCALILYALSKNINLFYTPTELTKENVSGNTVRVGGMVMQKSFHTDNDLNNTFTITDYQNSIQVHYRGILPDLFKEGQGVVVTGQLKGDQFQATQVLAKHDENYMPPEIKHLAKDSTPPGHVKTTSRDLLAGSRAPSDHQGQGKHHDS